MKKTRKVGIVILLLVAMSIAAYAITSLFTSKSIKSKLTKKTIFEFNLEADIENTEIGPGDSFAVNPTVTNDGTEEMYAFVKIDSAEANGSMIYAINNADDWDVVEETSDSVVYAYTDGNGEMYRLAPGEVTTNVTDEITMKDISNAEYAAIDDINVEITGCVIGTEGVSSSPETAWKECKEVGGID